VRPGRGGAGIKSFTVPNLRTASLEGKGFRTARSCQGSVAGVLIAGMEPLEDLHGALDREARVLTATIVALADELAAAAGLVMKKAAGVPVALIQGLEWQAAEGSSAPLVRRGISIYSGELRLFRALINDSGPAGSRCVHRAAALAAWPSGAVGRSWKI
jgi:hypothetical protein